MHRFRAPDEVADPAALSTIFGPVRTVDRQPLLTPGGFTGATFERLEVTLETGERRRLVTKRRRLSTDWTVARSGDTTGRTTSMLTEPRLAGIWDAFACPYVAFATAPDELVLVMDDLAPHLLPDVREPLREVEEDRLLRALATLHARFWESPALELPWLSRPEQHASMLDPRCAADPRALAVFPESMRESGVRGWAAALQRLPHAARALMECPATELAWAWEGLPRTLLHGDAKVANFALLPDGRVAAFDWPLIGAGPATLDLGWYVAVNATRLVGSKEDTFRRYRARLDEARGVTLDDACWDGLGRAGIVIGARMLLWSKALAVEAGRAGAQEEWEWWAERLEAIGARAGSE